MVRRAANRTPTERDLAISGITPDGLGVALDETRVFHVRNALPGENVRARILRKRKGVRFADAIAIVEGSEQRVPSACGYFPRCGGCNMHHLTYTEQLKLKQSYLAQCLEQEGVRPQAWVSPCSTGRLGYRTKARLGVRKLGDQVLVGFRESFSNRVAKMSECIALTPQLSALVGPLKRLIANLSISDQIPQVEVAQGDNGISLLVRHLAPVSDADEELLRRFARAHRVQLLLQSKGYDTLSCVEGNETELRLYTLSEFGLVMHFHPAQFTQVNQAMNQQLIRRVGAMLGDVGERRIVDLFCGIGNFTLPFARRGAQTWGFEAGEDAVQMAQFNAAFNGLSSRTEFASLDLYTQPAPLPERFDTLILDPPRSGAGPQLAGWLSHAVRAGCEDIIYVSCNPKTFAGDVALMAQSGFALKQVGVHDMFPHTGHVETLGWLQR